MHLKILSHPIFISLNFHLPMVVDLSHPLIMLEGENGSGKSTLLHSIFYALRGEELDGYAYKLNKPGGEDIGKVLLFDAEQHNPRTQPEIYEDNPQMKEFIETASHGQVMLSLFSNTFPSLPDGTVLLLDEPEMALSQSNQRANAQDAARACRPKEIPHHRRDAFPDLAGSRRDLRDQP